MDATAGSGEAAIRFDAVGKRYPDGTVAVAELTLEVSSGEVVVLVGPSGCGKTTTMRMVNRLVDPTSGRVLVDGRDVAGVDPVRLRRGIGYVIQQVGLFPHRNVIANVATVPRLAGWDRGRATRRATELLTLVGLDPDLHGRRFPHQLSGGQQQRVGVARALAADPPLLLMDEPFGAVDPIARDRLQAEFLRLQRAVRKTVLFVTHDVAEAVRLGDRIAVLSEGGRLEQYAPPVEVLARPASPFVADFVGRDRTITQLSAMRVREAALEPARSGDGSRPAVAPEPVDPESTLADAMAVILGNDAAWVPVAGDADRILTLDGIHAAVRRAAADGDGSAGD